MCGIAGYVMREGNPQLSMLKEMCGLIRHRGPDDEGYHLDECCGLGMRRLSIIDLTTGHQPISNEDGTVWVVFNGEIYNFRELRGSLEEQGHRFRTGSDTETLVHLYEQHGPEGWRLLRGMFACAIWDSRNKELTLVRDRFGKKPLYYSYLSAGLFFASELKCLRHAGVPLDIDRDALRLYFQFSYIPDPSTPFRAVRKLPAGSWLVYRADGSIRQGRYWKVPAPTEVVNEGLAEEDASARLREIIDEAVRVRMIADVPLGAFLSGGIDSSAVVASMALQSSGPVKTFSVGFEESAFNELQYASIVAAHYGTDHHEIVVRPDAVKLVSGLVRHFDEPFGDESAVPTFIVSEFAARHVKVALSGDGGDELFGGYDSFLLTDRLRRWDRVPLAVRRFLGWLSETVPYAAYGKNYLRMVSRPTALDRYFESNYAPYFLRQRLLQPEWMLPADGAYYARAFADCLLPGNADILLQAMYFEATANLTGDMLVKIDRMAMANSLEVRCPLLDHRLAEFAAAIPSAWKLRNGRGKQILLKTVRDRLPPVILRRGKMGFGVPVAEWFRGSLRDFLWDHLKSTAFLDREMVSARFVEHLLLEHDRRRRDNSHWLWALLMLELWFRDLQQSV